MFAHEGFVFVEILCVIVEVFVYLWKFLVNLWRFVEILCVIVEVSSLFVEILCLFVEIFVCWWRFCVFLCVCGGFLLFVCLWSLFV